MTASSSTHRQELGSAGSLANLLARTTLHNLPWLQRVTLLSGVAAGVGAARPTTARAPVESFSHPPSQSFSTPRCPPSSTAT